MVSSRIRRQASSANQGRRTGEGRREPALYGTHSLLFVEIYGAFAGNMALATLARGGVYIAGGIARKIEHKLGDGSFVRAFTDKERFSDLLRRHPLHIVTDSKVGLKGALLLIRKKTRA